MTIAFLLSRKSKYKPQIFFNIYLTFINSILTYFLFYTCAFCSIGGCVGMQKYLQKLLKAEKRPFFSNLNINLYEYKLHVTAHATV